MTSPVIIVAGLGRCGTSLMMQMLQAGGIPCVGEYPAFEDQRSEAFNLTTDWLADQAGKAVKLLDPHHSGADFRSVPRLVIWVDRDVTEQAKSQVKFATAIFTTLEVDKHTWKRIRRLLPEERSAALRMIGTRQCSWQDFAFESLLADPLQAANLVRDHLRGAGFAFDPVAASKVVRKRGPECYDGLLEVQLIEEMSPAPYLSREDAARAWPTTNSRND